MQGVCSVTSSLPCASRVVLVKIRVKSRQIETGDFEQGMSENSLLLGEYYNFHRPEV